MLVELDVAGSRVEPEPGERIEACAQVSRGGPIEDEVEMRNSDVVAPDVNLFHVRRSSRENLS